MKYYDSSRKQLIYIREKATPDYWDKHWSTENIRQRIFNSGKRSFVARITKKYLDPSEGQILEGGCGLASNVESLRLNGFKCIGVDNAKKTVQILQDNIPELDIRFGDVKKLDFPDNYFVGYWSLGIIEHFQSGYDDIADEMSRVIKQSGYLFLLFPYMSYIRKIKSKLKFYKEFNNQDISDFYQFALNTTHVIKSFEEKKFRLIKKKPRGVLYGIKDESALLSPIINFLINHKNKNIFTKVFYFILNSILSLICAHIFAHTILLVFRKTMN